MPAGSIDLLSGEKRRRLPLKRITGRAGQMYDPAGPAMSRVAGMPRIHFECVGLRNGRVKFFVDVVDPWDRES